MAKQKSTQAAQCDPVDYQAEYDRAFKALITSTEPNEILGFFELAQCANKQKPAPSEKDRIDLEKWQEWIEDDTEKDRRSLAADAVKFARWLMMHKAERKEKNTVSFPAGLEDLGVLIAFVRDHKLPDRDKIVHAQDNFFLATKDSGIFSADVEIEEDIGDNQNLTINLMWAIPSTGERPSIAEAIKGAHLAWVLHREEYGEKHPLAGAVEAWVLRFSPISPFKPKNRGQLALFDKIEAGEAKRLIEVQPEPPPDSQLFLEFPELQRAGGASWLLNLYDLAGGEANSRGRGAPWSMRLLIGGLLHVPVEHRDGEGHYFSLPTSEVVDWLFPGSKWTSKYARWDSLTKSLKEVNRLGWIPVPGVGSVHVFGVSVIPEKPSDPFVQFIARVPPSAANGARIDWPKLCKYGKESAPLYRAYLTACEFMHRSARDGHPVTEVIGKALLGPDGEPIRKKAKKGEKPKIARSKTEFEPNPAAHYVKGLTKAELTAAIGLDAASRSNQAATMKAFGQLADDGVIDLQKEGRGQYQKFFLFGPNQWAQAEAEVARGESNTTAYKK